MGKQYRKLLVISLIFAVVACFGGIAAASSIIPDDLAIDFRDWTGANGQYSFTVDNVTASSIGGPLYQDDIDGLGIQCGEKDEIDCCEKLTVNILDGKCLTGVWITDLFEEPDGGATGERGQVVINGMTTFSFFGNDADQENGEYFVDFGGSLTVNSAVFSAIGCGSEFSVAGFTGCPVPVPATLLLFGSGLIGLVGIGRKKLFTE